MAEGMSGAEVAKRTGYTVVQISRPRRRVSEEGIVGSDDKRLAEAGIERFVGQRRRFLRQCPRGVIGLFKTEVIRQHGPWRNIDAVESAALEWVDWFNNRRWTNAFASGCMSPNTQMPPLKNT